MSNSVTRAEIWGQSVAVMADWAQAASPVWARYGDGEWQGTHYQVADFRHSDRDALQTMLALFARESGSSLDDPDVGEAIEAAMAEAEEVDEADDEADDDES